MNNKDLLNLRNMQNNKVKTAIELAADPADIDLDSLKLDRSLRETDF